MEDHAHTHARTVPLTNIVAACISVANRNRVTVSLWLTIIFWIHGLCLLLAGNVRFYIMIMIRQKILLAQGLWQYVCMCDIWTALWIVACRVSERYAWTMNSWGVTWPLQACVLAGPVQWHSMYSRLAGPVRLALICAQQVIRHQDGGFNGCP